MNGWGNNYYNNHMRKCRNLHKSKTLKQKKEIDYNYSKQSVIRLLVRFTNETLSHIKEQGLHKQTSKSYSFVIFAMMKSTTILLVLVAVLLFAGCFGMIVNNKAFSFFHSFFFHSFILIIYYYYRWGTG